MSHYAPQATLKPKHLKITLKTVISILCCARVLGGCSKHVAPQQQSFCRQMCCVCVE